MMLDDMHQKAPTDAEFKRVWMLCFARGASLNHSRMYYPDGTQSGPGFTIMRLTRSYFAKWCETLPEVEAWLEADRASAAAGEGGAP